MCLDVWVGGHVTCFGVCSFLTESYKNSNVAPPQFCKRMGIKGPFHISLKSVSENAVLDMSKYDWPIFSLTFVTLWIVYSFFFFNFILLSL